MRDLDPPNHRGPADGRLVRTLKDGYWDRTEVVELEDGSLRVRKSSKGNAPPGPWGAAALRKEIAYRFCEAHGRRQRLVSAARLGIAATNADSVAPVGAEPINSRPTDPVA